MLGVFHQLGRFVKWRNLYFRSLQARSIALIREAAQLDPSTDGYARFRACPSPPPPLVTQLKPVYVQTFCVRPIQFLFSARAPRLHRRQVEPDKDVMFLRQLQLVAGTVTDITNFPVRFRLMIQRSVFSTMDQIVGSLGTVYVQQGLRQAHKLVASIDVLGNPLKVITNVSAGTHALMTNLAQQHQHQEDAPRPTFWGVMGRVVAGLLGDVIDGVGNVARGLFKLLETVRVVDGDDLLAMWPPILRINRGALECPDGLGEAVLRGAVVFVELLIASVCGLFVYPLRGYSKHKDSTEQVNSDTRKRWLFCGIGLLYGVSSFFCGTIGAILLLIHSCAAGFRVVLQRLPNIAYIRPPRSFPADHAVQQFSFHTSQAARVQRTAVKSVGRTSLQPVVIACPLPPLQQQKAAGKRWMGEKTKRKESRYDARARLNALKDYIIVTPDLVLCVRDGATRWVCRRGDIAAVHVKAPAHWVDALYALSRMDGVGAAFGHRKRGINVLSNQQQERAKVSQALSAAWRWFLMEKNNLQKRLNHRTRMSVQGSTAEPGHVPTADYRSGRTTCLSPHTEEPFQSGLGVWRRQQPSLPSKGSLENEANRKSVLRATSATALSTAAAALSGRGSEQIFTVQVTIRNGLGLSEHALRNPQKAYYQYMQHFAARGGVVEAVRFGHRLEAHNETQPTGELRVTPTVNGESPARKPIGKEDTGQQEALAAVSTPRAEDGLLSEAGFTRDSRGETNRTRLTKDRHAPRTSTHQRAPNSQRGSPESKLKGSPKSSLGTERSLKSDSDKHNLAGLERGRERWKFFTRNRRNLVNGPEEAEVGGGFSPLDRLEEGRRTDDEESSKMSECDDLSEQKKSGQGCREQGFVHFLSGWGSSLRGCLPFGAGQKNKSKKQKLNESPQVMAVTSIGAEERFRPGVDGLGRRQSGAGELGSEPVAPAESDWLTTLVETLQRIVRSIRDGLKALVTMLWREPPLPPLGVSFEVQVTGWDAAISAFDTLASQIQDRKH
ncbi:amine-terminal region of a tm vesicle-mediated sorter [Cystoisospora suis]|uniref:Amine-terminal region of a tm vesicle-mediated sorter n=1 Tax=Cystoisospora suis TaxID=483139 RepID=A0A2C6L0E4_9APIC|nr:amine-terminal region of a tm vesicle-mediated sorter [Cystoisospora suis]